MPPKSAIKSVTKTKNITSVSLANLVSSATKGGEPTVTDWVTRFDSGADQEPQ